MNNLFKRMISVVLVFVALFGVATGINGFELNAKAESAKITSYEQGDIIEFGWYPQSEVTDSSTIAALNSADGKWISYGYYSGTGSWYDGNMTAGDYMRYKDVVYGSDKYRGVVFDTYRPYFTGYTSRSTNQEDNGYTYGNVYWFKYEPIEWRVLDPSTGMVMAKTILDSQAYNNYILSSGTDEYGYTAYWGDSAKTYYANNYANSSIREWLNEDFYNTAFSKAQQDIIEYTELDNSAYSSSYSAYDSVTTYDKIYLLSYDDVLNTEYGFSSDYNDYDTARRARGSDYAKCQGLDVSTLSYYNGNSYWRLRSAGDCSLSTCDVYFNGCAYNTNHTSSTSHGVRPALNFNLSSEIFQSEVKDTGEASGTTPTTTVPKTTTITETTTILETTTIPETTTVPETTAIPETTTIPETTAIPETATTPETTTVPESTTIPETTTKQEIVFEIRTPSQTEIVFGDAIVLHADFKNGIPDGAKVIWTSDSNNFVISETSANGTTCVITPESSGDTTFVATVIDVDGNIIASDTQKMTSKAGFFQKIIAFFKKLFGATKVIPEAFKSNQ